MDQELSIELLKSQSDQIKLLVWIGSGIITGLVGAIVALWIKSNKQEAYIREQDKENRLILTGIGTSFTLLGKDITRIDRVTSEDIKPDVKWNRDNIKQALENGN